MSSKIKAVANGPASWTDLGLRLGITRQTLCQWRKLDGAPQDLHEQAWREWMASREVERKEDSSTKRLRELRVEIEEEKLRKIRLQNEELAGRAIMIEDVEEFLRVATAKWDSALTLKLETEGQHRVDGGNAPERLIQLREIHDELREISLNLFTWRPD